MATTVITPEAEQVGNAVPESRSGKRAPVTEPAAREEWTATQRVAFRIAFIFLIIMCIPVTAEWWNNLVTINWFHLHYRDLYDIARFSPSIYKFQNPAYNLLGYIDWVEALAIGIVGGLIWTALDNKNKQYHNLYYWLRVVVRYRAGIGIIGFGFTKLFPVQMPYPSLGVLNAHFGDLTAQKIYWLSVGIVPWYQVFAGVVELTAGTMLFFRKTTTFGAILLLGALGDITYVNFAYDGGVHVYASYFVLFSAFLLWYDAVPVYNLIVKESFTVPPVLIPVFTQKWLRVTRIVLKTATIGIFLVWLYYLQYVNFKYDPYKQPAMSGLKQLRGNYNVSEFKFNGQDIPYSPLDSVRWQGVTFEKWSSLTFNVNKPLNLDLSNGGGAAMRDINRNFELTGVAGGKRVFYYDADTVNKVLYLQDKLPEFTKRKGKRGNRGGDKGGDNKLAKSFIPAEAKANIRNEVTAIDPAAQSTRRERGVSQELKDKRKRARMVLYYTADASGSHIVLTGKDDKKNDVYIVLDRVNRQYALTDSKLVAGKY
ncbi:hypothetical protein ACFFGT_15120 [Mucilaginibacter angelicae]|uniref:DoxX family protein n=1 Tax=Mucilaginibacter angelicae TaxID=869718 RepID=A0ABV6L7U0_9SPHI